MDMIDKYGISKYEWEEYRWVQIDGSYNMLDPNARAMTCLTQKEWSTIIKNYSELYNYYEGGK